MFATYGGAALPDVDERLAGCLGPEELEVVLPPAREAAEVAGHRALDPLSGLLEKAADGGRELLVLDLVDGLAVPAFQFHPDEPPGRGTRGV